MLDQLYLRLVQRDLGRVCELLLNYLVEFVLVVDNILWSANLLDDYVNNFVKYVLKQLLENVLLSSAVLLQVELAQVDYVHLEFFELQVLAKLFEAKHQIRQELVVLLAVLRRTGALHLVCGAYRDSNQRLLVLQRSHLLELHVEQRLKYLMTEQLLNQVDELDNVRVLIRLLLVVQTKARLLEVRTEFSVTLLRKLDLVRYLAELLEAL